MKYLKAFNHITLISLMIVKEERNIKKTIFSLIIFILAISFVLIGSLQINQAYAVDLTQDLVLHWQFEEGWGRNVLDSSPAGNKGFLVNLDPATARVADKIGQAISFYNPWDTVKLKYGSPLALGTNNVTVAFWIKAPVGGYRSLMRYKASNNNMFTLVLRTNGRVRADIIKGNSRLITPNDGTIITDNRWHHVVVSFNRNGDMIRYINGMRDGSSKDISGLLADLASCKSFSLTMRHNSINFDGLMDEARIYERLLSEEDILALYLNDKERYHPYSTQMHVHSSLSEGPGSMDSETENAKRAGVDIIWWTDHDFRTTYYHHVTSFEFEDITEPLDQNEAWSNADSIEKHGIKRIKPYRWSSFKDWFSLYRNSFDDSLEYSGQKSLKLRVIGKTNEMQNYFWRFLSSRNRFKRSLASNVSIEIAIFPVMISGEGTAVVQIQLSNHKPTAEIPDVKNYYLHYYLSNLDWPQRIDNVFYIPLSYDLGEWNAYTLNISQDTIDAFPFINGEDNSMNEIFFGLKAKEPAEVIANFDSFRVYHDIEGQSLLDKQKQMAEHLESIEPTVKHHVGTEYSYWVHMNEFSEDTQLYDYDVLYANSRYYDHVNGWVTDIQGMRGDIAKFIVDEAHSRGGVVSYDHMFGTKEAFNPASWTKEEVLDRLLENKVYGADILEVGYRVRERYLADLLWVWDRLARNNFFLVGNGVSDNHGGLADSYQEREDNFVTWIYADSDEKSELIEGLKRGRVFFGDITLVGPDVSVNLTTPQRFKMGQIIVSDKINQQINIRIEGLSNNDTVKIMRNGNRRSTHTTWGTTYNRDIWVTLNNYGVSFWRTEVYSSSGQEKIFSNPIYFVRDVPKDGIQSFKVGIDLGGLFSRDFKNFTLTDAQMDGTMLTIGGTANNGQVILDVFGCSSQEPVIFYGLTGNYEFKGDYLIISNINGHGEFTTVCQ